MTVQFVSNNCFTIKKNNIRRYHSYNKLWYNVNDIKAYLQNKGISYEKHINEICDYNPLVGIKNMMYHLCEPYIDENILQSLPI